MENINLPRIEIILSKVYEIEDNMLTFKFEKKFNEQISKIILNEYDLKHIEKLIIGNTIFTIDHTKFSIITAHFDNTIDDHNIGIIYFTEKYLESCIQICNYKCTYKIPFYKKMFNCIELEIITINEKDFQKINKNQINSCEKITYFLVKLPKIHIEISKPISTQILLIKLDNE